jgi:tRNA threonylcarbamoyladenosine biosynthesis protein TsaB
VHILALDTTTRAGSSAVLRDDHVLAVVAGDGTRTHGERLPGELDEALRRAAVPFSAVDLLAVARGPGAFTGLRIGLAAMQGLALTSGRPIAGVSALDAIALAAPPLDAPADCLVGAVMDAGRGELFGALIRVGSSPDGTRTVTPLTEPVVGPADLVWQGWSAWHDATIWLCGDGVPRLDLARAGVAGTWPVPPLAPAVGELARRVWLATPDEARSGLTPHHLQPLYIRRPDVELARG